MTSDVTYQWFKSNRKIVGATDATLTIDNVEASDEGRYRVLVRNSNGAARSRWANLIIDDDEDGIADSTEIRLFGGLFQGPDDDFDNDGITNAEELEDGTNPTRNTSRFFRLTVAAVRGRVEVKPASTTGRYRPGTRVTLTPIPDEGNQFAEWQGTFQGLNELLRLRMDRDVTQTAVFGTSLGHALNAPQLPWETGGAGNWVGQRDISHDTRAAGESPELTEAGATFVSTYVEGPATVSFWWLLPDSSSASLVFEVNGTQSGTATNDGVWRQRSVSLNRGVHLLKWTLTEPGGSPSDAKAWLDEVEVSTLADIPLPQAVDAPDFSFASDRMNPWRGTDTGALDGIDCAVATINGQYRSTWIETRVKGPGTLDFDWRMEGDGGFMTVYVDGFQQDSTSSSSWRNAQVELDRGPHTIRWVLDTERDSYATVEYANGFLDRFRWRRTTGASSAPAPSISWTQALDDHSRAWASGGAKWVPTNTSWETYDGTDALMSGRVGNRGKSWIESRFTGPGNLSFRWKVSSATGDRLSVQLDGVEQDSIEGSTSYLYKTIAIPVGVHTVRWQYAKNGAGRGGDDRGYLDTVSFSSTAPQPPPGPPSLSGPPVTELADAVDQTSLLFATGGSQDFQSVTDTTHDGVDAATNGIITHSQESWMETILDGAGTLSFWWKVSSEGSFDYLRVQIDGVEQDRISGDVDWQQKTYTIGTEGLHVVRWRYTKDGSVNSLSDRGWVDEVTWTGESGGQGGGDSFAFAPSPLRVGAEGGTFPILIVGTGDWTAESNASWASVNPATGTDDATIQVTVEPRDSTRGRQAVLTIGGKEIPVIQEGILKPVLGTLASNAEMMMGDSFFASFVSYNAPTRFRASGLPAGLTIDPDTGVISGTVERAGNYVIRITGENAAGRSAPITIRLRANLPVISKGTYTGLIPPNSNLNGNLGGLAKITLAPNGAVTGWLFMGAERTRIRGFVGVDTAGGGARLQLEIPREEDTLSLDLSFDPGRDLGSADGTLQVLGDGGSSVRVVMWKNLWHAKRNPANSYKGLFNSFLILPDDVIGDSSIPQGYGIVAATVASSGQVRFTGNTGDGEKVTGASHLWPNGEVPFYGPLYRSTGTIQGILGIDAEKKISGIVDWFKMAQDDSERSYRDGFGPLRIRLFGEAYVRPAKGTLVLGLPAEEDNAEIGFSGGDIESAERFAALNQIFTLTSKGGRFDTENNTALLKFAYSSKNGRFSGGFVLRDPDTDEGAIRKVKFSGLIVPGLGAGGGFFVLPGLTPDTATSDILSGKVEFGPPLP